MKPFLDTNILVYAQTDDHRAARARALIEAGGTISVQVLNECANVLHRKLRRNWGEIEQALDDLRLLPGPALPVTELTHIQGLMPARHHGFSFHDALILASAIDAGCTTLLSGDMQHGRVVGPLVISNPFL